MAPVLVSVGDGATVGGSACWQHRQVLKPLTIEGRQDGWARFQISNVCNPAAMQGYWWRHLTVQLWKPQSILTKVLFWSKVYIWSYNCCISAVVQARVPNHWHHSSQHLGLVPAGAPARLRFGGDPSLLLECLATRPLAHQDVLQGIQANDGEGRCRGELGGCHGGWQ